MLSLLRSFSAIGAVSYGIDPGKIIASESSNPSRVVLILRLDVIWSTLSSELRAPSYEDKG